MFREVSVRVKSMPSVTLTVYQYKHLGSRSALWHCFIYRYGHSLCLKKHHVAAPAHRWIFGQSSFKLGSRDGFRQARSSWRAALQPRSGQVMRWPCLQSRCLLLSHLYWTPVTASEGLRSWVTQTQNTWTVPCRTYFPPLAITREGVTYQHLKWDAVVATAGPVLSACDSAAGVREGFLFTGSLGRFPFHVDVRLKLAFEKN